MVLHSVSPGCVARHQIDFGRVMAKLPREIDHHHARSLQHNTKDDGTGSTMESLGNAVIHLFTSVCLVRQILE